MQQNKIEKKSIENKENIPEKFMKHIVSLGFKETDADVLYKDKENWIGASKGRVPFVHAIYSRVTEVLAFLLDHFPH